MTNHSDQIPNYIKALSPRGLRVAMFKNNSEMGAECQYFDIQQFEEKNGKKYWIAWYYSRVKDIDELTEEL